MCDAVVTATRCSVATGSRVSESDPVFVAFARALYCCFWAENTPPWNLWGCSSLKLSLHFYFFFISQYLINLQLCWKFSSVCVLHRPDTFDRKHSLVAHRRQNNLSVRVGSPGQKRPGRVRSRVKGSDPVPSMTR